MKLNGTPNSEPPAPDGEEYWANGAVFRLRPMGNGKGIYDYRAEAERLLESMKNRKIIDGRTSNGAETGGPKFRPELRICGGSTTPILPTNF
jgi:oligosaccharide reducing-end xylanase